MTTLPALAAAYEPTPADLAELQVWLHETAPDAEAADVEAPASDWPAWTDADRWEPTDPADYEGPSAADDAWYAGQIAAAEARRDDAELIARAAAAVRESRAMFARLERQARGYESAELAEMGSLVGHDA